MNANTKATSVAVLVALGLAAAGNALCAEEPMNKPTTSTPPNPAGKIADVFHPVDLRKVKVGGELADYLIGRWPGKPAGWTERIPGNEEIAFIKTGLDPSRSHTIRVVVRGDRNADASGTAIRHIGFEGQG